MNFAIWKISSKPASVAYENPIFKCCHLCVRLISNELVKMVHCFRYCTATRLTSGLALNNAQRYYFFLSIILPSIHRRGKHSITALIWFSILVTIWDTMQGNFGSTSCTAEFSAYIEELVVNVAWTGYSNKVSITDSYLVGLCWLRKHPCQVTEPAVSFKDFAVLMVTEIDLFFWYFYWCHFNQSSISLRNWQ